MCINDSPPMYGLQEALLMEGADDQEMFDFERELNDVGGIPEELLNAVAELTGEDTNTLRSVTCLCNP